MLAILPIVSLSLPIIASAQSTPGALHSDQIDEVEATFVDTPPKVDGILDDSVWDSVPVIDDFYQIWPDDGAEGSEYSEVQIAYDRDNLYFAFRFRDKDPELIRAKNLERGGRNDRDDHAYIALDTYMDKRNAYLFEVNALGTQDDATITDEGLTIDSFSWDAVFRSETNIDDEGWTMEVSIPFRQLRFPKGDELEFGLMLSRMINRKNERVIWPHIGLEFGSSFTAMAAVSQYGKLTGLKDVKRGKNIEIKPYIIGGGQQFRTTLDGEVDKDTNGDIGVDIKYGVTSNLTVDLSVNTDFAQVEADNVQLNLSRFSLFFPEKREFFLERSGLFEHGNSQSTQTFFSRRIGLTEDILAGARLTGQVGRFSVGLLNIESGDSFGDIFGSNTTNNMVARVRTNIIPRATAGAILTNFDQENYFNRAGGIDGQYRFWSSSEASAWYTQTWESGDSLNSSAGHASLRLQNNLYGARASFTSVGKTFDPALGFVRRNNMRQYSTRGQYTPVVSISSLPMIRRLNFQVDYEYIEGQDSDLQSTEFEVQAGANFNRRDGVEISYERSFERLMVPFEIRQGAVIPDDDYTFGSFRISGETDSSRRTFGSARVSSGTFFNGNRTDLGGSLGFRQSRHLQLEGSLSHSIIDLPVANGEFDATTLSLSVLGALNRKLFAKALVQYDNFTRDIQANIRINWIHTPGSDLFLVLNTAYHFTDDDVDVLLDPRRDLIMLNRAGVVKLTYLILL